MAITQSIRLVLVMAFMALGTIAFCQDHDHHDHDGHDHGTLQSEDHSGHDHSSHGDNSHSACGGHHGDGDYDPKATAMHHISDANVYTILDAIRIPLPCLVYSKDGGWDFFMSSKLGPGHHDDGHYAYNGYVMHLGNLKRVVEEGFPMQGKVEVGGFSTEYISKEGKEIEQAKVCHNNKPYLLEAKTTLDGGLLGGGITNFYDFSITKNVLSMILVSILLFVILRRAAKSYTTRQGQAPKGIQSLLEPVIVYIRDEVAKPFIGDKKYLKYMPFLLSVFFFILGLNLWGQVPFLGSANVTGNLTVTMVVAIIVFLISNFNGNKHYWQHIFWMPGVPLFVKPLLAIIEIMSLFIKPLTLMLRLAGNITAGHIAILSFVGLIFIFGDSGRSMSGGVIGSILSVALTLFMMSIELIVAFIQAYVFTLLSASYIGAAIEEHEHH